MQSSALSYDFPPAQDSRHPRASLFWTSGEHLDVEMAPLQCKRVLVRTSELRATAPDWAWDVDSGLYAYGTRAQIEHAWVVLADAMASKLHVPTSHFMEVDIPQHIAHFESAINDVAIIVGAGSYTALDQELVVMLNTLSAVTWGEIGAQHSEGADAWDTILERCNHSLVQSNGALSETERHLCGERFLAHDDDMQNDLRDRFSALIAHLQL